MAGFDLIQLMTLDPITALVGGLTNQQRVQNPGGTRWIRRTIDMYLAEV
jgi:hypothetical protein